MNRNNNPKINNNHCCLDTCLKQAGLEIPITVQLIRALEKRKIHVPKKIKVDELVSELCQLKSKI